MPQKDHWRNVSKGLFSSLRLTSKRHRPSVNTYRQFLAAPQCASDLGSLDRVSRPYPVDGALGAIALGMQLAGEQFESIPRFEMAGYSADCQPHLPLHDQRPSFERMRVRSRDR